MSLSLVSCLHCKYFMLIVHFMDVGTSNRGKNKCVFVRSCTHTCRWVVDACPSISLSDYESRGRKMDGNLIQLVLMPVGVKSTQLAWYPVLESGLMNKSLTTYNSKSLSHYTAQRNKCGF
jgi:hypothetical protein